MDILQKIYNTKIIAIIRTYSADKAVDLCRAIFEGGIDVIEITFSVPHAAKVIEKISALMGDELLLGAGTVLDQETAKNAIEAGAKFIVSPNFSKKTAETVSRYGLQYIPGVLTPTEIVQALESGCNFLKLFPANLVGPSFIKTIHGPLPQANLIATGGVNLENAKSWLEAGAVGIGIGSSLTKGSLTEVTEKAKRFCEITKDFRQ